MKDVLIEDLQQLSDSDLPFECFRRKTFLVTGATGLVGSLLVKALLYCNKRHDLNLKVFAVVRNKGKADQIFEDFSNDPALGYVIADLTCDEISVEDNCDYVIHAAAVTTSRIMVQDPVGTIKTAVDGTDKILKFAVEKKAEAVVYISSMEVYGQPNGDGKTAEKDLGLVDITTVRSCYPEGKRMCECLCTAYASQYGLNVKTARLAQTFGAGILPSENRVFAQFARSAMGGKDIVLHTTGESEGNYVYTRDAIKAILLLLVRGDAGQPYNIANEESHITIRSMAELVAKEIADDQIKVIIDIPEDQAALGYAPAVRMWLDSSRMRSLGWKPEVNLIESYRRMIEWMRR
ncbi:MAG: NAD-dependent epimerase/dehydratase family protein [Coprococcus sp.]